MAVRTVFLRLRRRPRSVRRRGYPGSTRRRWMSKRWRSMATRVGGGRSAARDCDATSGSPPITRLGRGGDRTGNHPTPRHPTASVRSNTSDAAPVERPDHWHDRGASATIGEPSPTIRDARSRLEETPCGPLRTQSPDPRSDRPPAVRRHALRANPGYRAVLLTHNETSTGVMNPIRDLAGAVRDASPESLILVDSVSGLGAVPFEMDDWGIDLVVTGSQKAWMSAPGLAMIAASDRGWAATETARMPRFYLDMRAHRESAAAGQTPFTPAIAVVFQVDEGLRR